MIRQQKQKKYYINLNIDPILMILVLITISFGIAVLYSSSGNGFVVPLKQMARFSIVLCLMFLISSLKPRQISDISPYLYLLGLLLLGFVFFKGHIGKGAQRWINLGIINFEPSEVMK